MKCSRFTKNYENNDSMFNISWNSIWMYYTYSLVNLSVEKSLMDEVEGGKKALMRIQQKILNMWKVGK